jgi:hypothetical protein
MNSSNNNVFRDSITLDLFDSDTNMNSSTIYSSADTITLSSVYGAVPSLTASTIGTLPWTVTGSTNWSQSANIMTDASGTISLKGEKADIDINGVSLVNTLKGIQDRLNILRPNLELEDKWDALKVLGQQYRELEAELLEKQNMWDTLKKMPPPEIE